MIIPPIRTLLWRVPLLVVGILGTGMLLGLEKYALYFPERAFEGTPKSQGLAYEDVRFPTSDGFRLHGWLVPASGARFTVVCFHGNAGNVSHRVDLIANLHRQLGVTVFIFDYRGYGQSDGSRSDLSEEATYRDAEGALAFLRGRPELTNTRLVYFGSSLGAAIAIEAARRYPPAGLVLETPFTSLRDIARVHFPLVPQFFLQIEYDNLTKIPSIRVPLLVLHGDRDEVVPLEQPRRLFAAANEPKTFHLIRGAHHNDTYIVGGDGYFQAWARFLNSLEAR
jgi:alpha-beta hydrolase superfamily lysophospholipase